MYSDWYVFQVLPRKEINIKNKIESISKDLIHMIVFQSEMIYLIRGTKVKVFKPLFPGYIFVYSKINEIIRLSHNNLLNDKIYPIMIGQKPCRVYKEEMDLLLQNSNNDGIFCLSSGIRIGDKVEITNGPLKSIQSKILWIDDKKNKAKVEFCLFSRKMKINLGIDVLTQFN